MDTYEARVALIRSLNHRIEEFFYEHPPEEMTIKQLNEEFTRFLVEKQRAA